MKQSRVKKIKLLVIFLFVLSSCDSTDDVSGNSAKMVESPAVSGILIADIGNQQNASDIQLSFNKVDNEAFVKEYRAFVVKNEKKSMFTLELAESLMLERYQQLAKTGANITGSLSANLKDSDGDGITNNIPYVIFILSLADGENANVNTLSKASAEFTLITAAEAITNLLVSDVANEQNASDIEIQFTKAANENYISEYRIIAVKAGQNLTLDLAEALSNDRYKAILKSGANIKLRFDSDSKDSDGDLIANDVSYRIYVPSIADGSNATINALSNPSNPITASAKTQAVSALEVADVWNNGNASDIRVSFNKLSDESTVSEYRVIVVKAQNVSNFDLSTAENLTEGRYFQIAKSASNIEETIDANTLDSDGDAIVEAIAYQLFVLSVADGTNAIINQLSTASSELTLEVTNLVVTLVKSINIGSGGMDVDAAGNIYAADFGSALSGGTVGTVVYKITADGQASQWASGLFGASGNEFDSQGFLFQSNIGNNTMSKIAPDGTVSLFLNNSSGLASPVGIVADPNDTLYVCNCGNNSILKVSPDGSTSQFVSNTNSLLSCPNGITMDENGNFYVSNFNNANVIKITANGSQSILGTTSGTNGHILYANSVLYVVARTANQIYKMTLDGQTSVLAGSGTRGLKDGSALDASLSLTNDVAISPDGKRLYFNDVVSLSGTNTLQPVAIRMILLDAE